MNGEGCVDDEISVVVDHGLNFYFPHLERRVL